MPDSRLSNMWSIETQGKKKVGKKKIKITCGAFLVAFKKNSRLITCTFFFFSRLFLYLKKITGQVSRLFQELKILYDPVNKKKKKEKNTVAFRLLRFAVMVASCGVL